MKTLLIFLFLLSSQAFSQQVQSSLPLSVDSCNGSAGKPPGNDDLIDELYDSQGIYLNRKYDWSNPTVNCHINKSIEHYDKYNTALKKMKSQATIGSVIGLPGFGLAIMGLTAAPPLIIPGAIIGLIGIGVSSGSKKFGKESDKEMLEVQYHMGEVRKYAQSRHW